MRTQDRVFGRPSAHYAVLTDADASGRRQRHWNDQWHFAMARIANACRAWGLRPVDGPYTDFGDAEGYRACAAARPGARLRGQVGDPPLPDRPGQPGVLALARRARMAARTGALLAQATRDGQGAVGTAACWSTWRTRSWSPTSASDRS
jgi:malyl-CoA/(S)-citramalyl-CoA lyase